MNSNEKLRFSIVVPTRDRPDPLSRCLEALASLRYPRDRYEVVVVDDGSTVSPKPVVDRVRDRLTVRLIEQQHAGPAAARNRGAKEAAHPYLAFTDDDCRPEPTWLDALSEALATDGTLLVGGRVVNVLTHNPYSDASQDLIGYLYEYYAKDGARFFCSNNLALARERFLAVGGFDTTFPFAAGEDRDFSDRCQIAGLKTRYAPDAVVGHAHSLDLRSFWRQHLRYGRAALRYHRLFASRRNRAVRVEPLRFYLNLLWHPFLSMPAHRAARCAALLVVAQLANASGFFYEHLATLGPPRRFLPRSMR